MLATAHANDRPRSLSLKTYAYLLICELSVSFIVSFQRLVLTGLILTVTSVLQRAYPRGSAVCKFLRFQAFGNSQQRHVAVNNYLRIEYLISWDLNFSDPAMVVIHHRLMPINARCRKRVEVRDVVRIQFQKAAGVA